MDFNADKILIKDFFSNNRRYIIPRYQREYSWGTEQLDDFYNDVINNCQFINEGSRNNDYFFGTVMLVGDMIQHKSPLQLVDGQQRITTFTIFLSVLSKLSKNYDEKISNNIWKYVIGIDDNGEEYKILENKTASPYFEEIIQSIAPDGIVQSIMEGTEQDRLNTAYEFLESKLRQDIKKLTTETKDAEIEIIKTIRDQILNSHLIYICSPTEEDVNAIFENINSKGKKLYTLDLIKNEIFSVEDSTIPMDKAKELWLQIKNNLIGKEQYIPVDTFYRHFWISNYNQSKIDDLYKKFLSSIKKENYFDFLKKLRDSSKIYMSLIEFDKTIFKGHKIGKRDLFQIERSLNNINNLFGITQSRIFLLALIETYLDNKIKFSKLMEVILFIEEFHFVYNAICKLPNNKLENRYGKFARKLRSSSDKTKVNVALTEFEADFKELIPDKNNFIEEFEKLNFRKKSPSHSQEQRNVISKYSIKKYEQILSEKNIYDYENESIEHIISESISDISGSVGNLLLLEQKINQDCGSLSVFEKKDFYKESKYISVKKFLDMYPENFSEKDIYDRAKNIASVIYDTLYS